jgi:AcrR family transcriptional regulator
MLKSAMPKETALSPPSHTSGSSDKRRRILEAARAVMAVKGYDDTAVSEIVRRAGIAQGTFYLYFKSKADLPYAFAEEIHLSVMDACKQIVCQEQPLQELFDALLRRMLSVAGDYSDILDTIAGQMLLDEEAAYAEERKKQMEPLITSLIKRHQEAGEVDPDLDPAIAVRLLEGTINRLARDLLLLKIDIPAEDYIRQATSFICRGLGATV